MINKFLGALALAALPALATAAPLTQTHEQVSTPGKSTVAFRPIAQRRAVPAKCHPEASKAVACEAQAAIARREALARQNAAQPAELSAR